MNSARRIATALAATAALALVGAVGTAAPAQADYTWGYVTGR